MTLSDRESEMSKTAVFARPAFHAVRRARLPVATIALTYLVSLFIGMAMAHAGSRFALDRRDRLVRHGETHDPAAIAFKQERWLKAMSIDFGRDCYRAVVKTLEGLTVVAPYALAVQGGWYGGILSVDSNHNSRLRDPLDALYYLCWEVLQIVSASLAAGAGMNLTLACFRSQPWYRGDKWWFVPREAVRDLLRIYLFVVPLLFIAAAWKYFVP